ncbi:MAG: hypothetical protein ACKVT0_13175 [Planctomycetaceae bacterium]
MAWLLTPRDDLGGVCPREIALDRHDHLTWDLQDRCEYWSLIGDCPPGLAESSHAYRYGGLGTHELVKYYELIRELLWTCWEHTTEFNQSSNASQGEDFLSVGDFLTREVPHLEAAREAWFDCPDPECHGRTPRSIINRERSRLPEGMSGHDAIIDPDCPCCQMMSDMPGPVFWHLDGSEMDDEFAFDIYHRTREEWDEEQIRWAEHRKKFDAEWSERERLGVTDSTSDGDSAIWSRSFCVGNTADVPLGFRVFGLGCRLAELIVALRADFEREMISTETQWQIDEINRDFGNLREILQGSNSSFTESLIDPVIDRFRSTLDAIVTKRPDLILQCDALCDDLAGLLNPQSPKSVWENGDSDIPF